jgi:hypothetical protein
MMFSGPDWASPQVDPSKYYGRRILSAALNTEALLLRLDDGVEVKIFDNARYCCEYRHMTCDDGLEHIVGSVLTAIEVKDGPHEEDPEEYVTHDICFVEVRTEAGFITIANHNEHNGYYGGFELAIEETQYDV